MNLSTLDMQPQAPNVAARARRLVLVQPAGAEQADLVRLLKPLVDELHAVSTLQELEASAEHDLYVVDYDPLSAEDRVALRQRFGQSSHQLLLLSSGAHQPDLVELLQTHTMTNLLARNQRVDARELWVTVQKLLHRDIFGLQPYFSWRYHSTSFTVRSSSELQGVVEQAQAYALSSGLPPRLAQLFTTVVDEFLTNAMFNAPIDEAGARRFRHMHRTEQFELEPSESVVLTLARDGERLGVSACDGFGSLAQGLLLDYLAKCFRKGSDQVDAKPGGAGLGLYVAFESVSQFIVNLSPGVRTEMIGLMDLTGSYRAFATKKKSFNVFTQGKGPTNG